MVEPGERELAFSPAEKKWRRQVSSGAVIRILDQGLSWAAAPGCLDTTDVTRRIAEVSTLRPEVCSGGIEVRRSAEEK